MAGRSGINLENIVRNHLTDMQFRVEKDNDWDHTQKIDFAVTRFPNMPAIYPVGVQITERCDDHAKLQEFAAINGGEYRMFPKSLYVEVDSAVDMEKGGAQLIAIALYQYQFDRSMQAMPVQGLRVNRGLTYEFFDPYAKLRGDVPKLTVQRESTVPIAGPPAPQSKSPATASVSKEQISEISSALKGHKQRLGGFIHTYFAARGFGLITGQDGSPYFLHIYSILDQNLRDKLNQLPSIDGPVNIEESVTFVDGGKTKADAKYPEAKEVRAA